MEKARSYKGVEIRPLPKGTLHCCWPVNWAISMEYKPVSSNPSIKPKDREEKFTTLREARDFINSFIK